MGLYVECNTHVFQQVRKSRTSKRLHINADLSRDLLVIFILYEVANCSSNKVAIRSLI